MNGELRFDTVMKRIDVYGRLAFGGQCVAAMAILAAPVLFVTASVLPFYLWDDERGRALLYWLGGWLLAVATGGAGVAVGVIAWRWSGDWITEWPGYAVGFGIAAVADAVLAYLLTSTDIPYYASFLMMIAAAFVAGMLVAGNLAGTRVLDEQQRAQRPRPVARRRP